MITTIAINYIAGLFINITKKRYLLKKLCLGLAVFCNLLILFYFKYSNLLVNTLIDKGVLQIAWDNVALPIGISFFIFQGISYVVDVYRNEAPVQNNPLKLALYIALFPQLIAGPIVRYSSIADQLDNRIESIDKVYQGASRFIIGLGKKIILANTLGRISDIVYNNLSDKSNACILFATLCYAMQIYFDFSGYSDMAIGLGKIFGFEFLENFNLPYISKSIREFWSRWHISLSTWFKDYLYIPLGGNRRGNEYLNLFIVFICTGLWHGASFVFLLWGLWHGLFLAIEHAVKKRKTKKDVSLCSNALKHIYTLAVVYFGWILFRVNSIADLKFIIRRLLNIEQDVYIAYDIGFFANNYSLFILILAILISCGALQKGYTKIAKKLGVYDISRIYIKPIALLVLFCLSIIYLINSNFNPFIYFQF